MTIVSIDFSILAPGVCICKDFKSFKWLAIANSKLRKKDKQNLEDLQLKYPSIKIKETESKRYKDKLYHVTERIKLDNYLELTTLLVDLIKDNIDPTDDIIVSIEGISFGSSGNSLVDISQSTGIFKEKLVREILKGDTSRLFVFSPGELKNSIGCKGNANKMSIFEAFTSDPILEETKQSDLYLAANSEDWIIEKDKVLSPLMDMIDAYLGIVKIHHILTQK